MTIDGGGAPIYSPLMTSQIHLTSRLGDRLAAARFIVRASRRAGAPRLSVAHQAVRMVFRGAATVTLRKLDADMYMALHRGLPPERALLRHQVQRLLRAGA